MSEDSAPDLLVVIGELTVAMEGARTDLQSLRDELKSVREDSEARDAELAKSARRSRRIIAGVIISVCLDLLITAGFAWNTIRVNDAQNASRAIQNASHASQITACQQANVNRGQDAAVLNQILADVAPPAARTPKVEAELAVLDRLIRVKDAPRNCAALYATKG
jgi:hypothetical protein